MGMFKFTCPHCSQQIEVDEEAKGQICNCPCCNQEIVICDDYAVGGNSDTPPEKDRVAFAPPPVEKKPDPYAPPTNKGPKPPQAEPVSLLRLLCRISSPILVILLCILIVMALWPVRWEYKVVKISGEAAGGYLSEEFRSKKLDEAGLTTELNLYYDKWELVSAVPEIETDYPTFGNKEYVTGIRTNTRSSSVVLIFRRRKLF